MANNTVPAASNEYKVIYPLYAGYAAKLRVLVEDLLISLSIKYQIIESRAKSIASFEEKIARPGKRYTDPMREITDFCGCRIIVYYQDDVFNVAEMLKREFEIVEENLSRQPELLDADRFGYLTAQYIVKISATRKILAEWHPYADLNAEVQIRTVIQHAWSAVSHALQYKQETLIPSKLQRRLVRIAGLFELADEEFIAIRNIREEISVNLQGLIKSDASSVNIEIASLTEFMATWDGKEELLSIAEVSGFNISQYFPDRNHIAIIYDLAVLGGINDLKQLKEALEIDPRHFFVNLISGDFKIWGANYSFIILLVLVYYGRDRITKEFFTKREFSENVAAHVMEVLSGMQTA